jgi:predicted TIM-barrel fold metal-dependent hydrolase
MAVVDVDCHFEIAVPPDEHPLRELREHLPTSIEYVSETIAGDLFHVTPEEDAPTKAELAAFLPAENRDSSRYATLESPTQHCFDSLTADQRLAWFTEAGIDFALVNPGAIGIMSYFLGEHSRQAMRLCNDFLAGHLDGHTDRMSPVAVIDWSDLDLAVAEMTRMRELGSRAFWLRAEPHGGKSPAHPDWDRVWAAATDLGMIAVLHVGNTPADFTGWGNAGWGSTNGTGLGGFFRFANCMRHQPAEMLLAAMVYGGVFGRHPSLTIVIEELGIGWLPYFVNRCDLLGWAGPWGFDRMPGEMIRQQVRAAPLPGLGDANPISDDLAALAEMLVFSSDYPHGEGNRDPKSLLAPTLEKLSAEQRQQFLGGNIADCYARMGDPLPV